MEEKEMCASMKKFFEKLLQTKSFTKKLYEDTGNEYFKEIYDQLHAAIKTTQEE